MKKSILGIAIIATMLVALLGTVVNAATLTATKEAKKGDTVEVTITTDSAVKSTSFGLTFDNQKFKLAENPVNTTLAGPVVNTVGNTVYVSVADANADHATKTITVKFEVIADVEKPTEEDFVISDYANNLDEELKATSVKTTLVKAEEDDNKNNEEQGNNTTEEPGNNEEKPSNNEEKPSNNTQNGNNTSNGSEKNDKEKLPQMGAPLFVGAIALIVVAGAVLVIRKVK